MNLARYATIIFDCDGVLLDSNRVKTEAFRTAASPWGSPAAEELVTYHIANGGISRYEKFAYFLGQILPTHVSDYAPGRHGPGLETMLATYANEAREGLMNCAVAEGLTELRATTSRSRWLIVSGGDQNELRHVFHQRGLAQLFDGGIYGSPDTKKEILRREIDQGTVQSPSIFLGDSRADHQAASEHDIDFLFVSGWTDLPEWKAYVASHGLNQIPAISTLLEKHQVE